MNFIKKIFICITILFTTSAFASPNEISYNVASIDSTITVDAESVIAKYISAIGGEEKLNSIVDKKNILVGDVQGIKLTLEIYQKAPNKYYQRMEAGELKQETWFDGDNGMQVAMGRKVPILGDQLEMMKVQAILNPQLHFKTIGITAEYSRTEKVNGRDAHELIINLPSGKQWLQYYDVETGYIIKQISNVDTPQGSSTVTSTYADYNEIDGIMYAHKITQSFGTQIFKLTLESCLVNSGLEDEMFEVD